MKDIVKEKQLKEVLYGLDYIANKSKSGKLELGVNNCKLLLEEIERLNKENEILRHRLEVANEYIDDRKENMIIDHVIDLKYIINECDLDSTW